MTISTTGSTPGRQPPAEGPGAARGVVQVPPRLEKPLADFAAILKGLFADRLVGLTLYGRAICPDSGGPEVVANTVLVLDKVELGALRRLAERGADLGRRQIASPLVITPGYLQASLDVFPLEWLEITQRRVTLAGRDYFESLALRPEHIRLQCERELKRILMRLRQGLLAAAGREHLLADLTADLGEHILRTLRGMVWLQEAGGYLTRETVLSRVEAMMGRSLPGVRAAMDATGAEGWPEFSALATDVEALATRADGG
jgi:hypothetical protein